MFPSPFDDDKTCCPRNNIGGTICDIGAFKFDPTNLPIDDQGDIDQRETCQPFATPTPTDAPTPEPEVPEDDTGTHMVIPTLSEWGMIIATILLGFLQY